MSWPGLPLLLKLQGRPVMLLGEGQAADAKRRLLERAGATIVGEQGTAAIAIVAMADAAETEAAVARLSARGLLVNAVDRPDLCDFTLPAIIDRSPVLLAVSTGGASAGLAAALRQRIEAWLPGGIGTLAAALDAARARLRTRWPDATDRRRAIGDALAPGGAIDPFGPAPDIEAWLHRPEIAPMSGLTHIRPNSPDPDDLTLREARALAQADRVLHQPGAPPAILDRARADAERLVAQTPPVSPPPGLTVFVEAL